MSHNRFKKIISDSGLLSRHKADLLIKQIKVKFNGRQAIPGKKAYPILVDETMTMPARIEVLDKVNSMTLLKVILKEGHNCQIPRITNLFGHPFQDLQRTTISNMNLDGLQGEEWREIKPVEWNSIFN